MAVPKRRTSRSRQGKRRSHLRLTEPNVTYCTKCGHPKLSHRACRRCGFYRDGLYVTGASAQE